MSSDNAHDAHTEAIDQARQERVVAILTELRLMSANSVMYGQATADSAGIHSTDMECLDLLLLHGPMTAGKLSELTGLTTGTVTALIDRLEKVGYVRRERVRHDRRQVIVAPDVAKINVELEPITRPMGIAAYALLQRYSDAELRLLLGFLKEGNTIAVQEIAALRRNEKMPRGHRARRPAAERQASE